MMITQTTTHLDHSMPPVGEGRQGRVARQGLLVVGEGGGVAGEDVVDHGEEGLCVLVGVGGKEGWWWMDR